MSKRAKFNMKFRVTVLTALTLAALLVAASMTLPLFAAKASAEPTAYVPAQVTVTEPVTAPVVKVEQEKVSVTTTPAPVAEPTVEAVAEPVAEVVAPVAIPVKVAPVAPKAKAVVPAPKQVHTEPLPVVAPCEEDEPCWDCKTMGNKICGPVAVPAEGPAGLGTGGAVKGTDPRPACTAKALVYAGAPEAGVLVKDSAYVAEAAGIMPQIQGARQFVNAVTKTMGYNLPGVTVAPSALYCNVYYVFSK